MDDTLTRHQHEVVLAARRALAQTLEDLAGPEQVLPLAVLAYSGAFVDIIAASTGRDDLIALMNQQLAGAGLKLVEMARH